MTSIKVNGKAYELVIDYKNNKKLRGYLNNLTKETYGFDFENWYQGGYWKDSYVPYSILDGDRIVSNVSITIIDFIIDDIKRTYIQIGTVMTHEAYRGQGLNRALMEKVLKDWKGNCDMIYLFANDTVLDFYPKFGFSPIQEYQHTRDIVSTKSTTDSIQLDMTDTKNKELLHKEVKTSFHYSKISVVDNTSLVMFYYISFTTQNVYYIKKYDAIVVATFHDTILHIHDIFSKKEIPVDAIIEAMSYKKIKKVVLGFTPKDTEQYDESPLEPDDKLFILDDKRELFKNARYRFPMLSHA